MDLEELSNEEVAVLLYALEREFDWARHGEDYDIAVEYFNACNNLLTVFKREYEQRNLNPNIIGVER